MIPFSIQYSHANLYKPSRTVPHYVTVLQDVNGLSPRHYIGLLVSVLTNVLTGDVNPNLIQHKLYTDGHKLNLSTVTS